MFSHERHRSRVRDGQLWCRKSPEGHEGASDVRKFVNLAVNCIFFESGTNKAAKGDGWAPPFICCSQDIVGL